MAAAETEIRVTVMNSGKVWGLFNALKIELQEQERIAAGLAAALATVKAGIDDFREWKQRSPTARLSASAWQSWATVIAEALRAWEARADG